MVNYLLFRQTSSASGGAALLLCSGEIHYSGGLFFRKIHINGEEKNMYNKICKTRSGRLMLSAMIAALYAATTLLLQPISFGTLQLRAAEALTLLPVLLPESVVGLTLGCAISNAVGVATGANVAGVLDIAIGTAATLLAALTSRALRRVKWRGLPVLAALMPIIFNGVFVGAELAAVLGLPFWLCALEVAGGEALVVFILGLPLMRILEKRLELGE